MATRDAKLRVGVEGEREYKQAISGINRENQVMNSEMKLLQERYAGNESSMEALTKKGELLQRQLQEQKDKVSTLQTALQNAKDTFGENDRRTQSWAIQLNNAEKEQIKLERALEQTNSDLKAQGEATEDAGEKMATLGDQVSGIAEKFGVHLPDSIKGALDNVNGFSAGTVAAMGAAVAGIAAVKVAIDGVKAGIEAVQKLHEMTLEQAAWADDLLTRSSQTGIDTGTLQGLDYAANFLDFEGLDKSLVKLTDSMGKAVTGAEKQAAAFAALGISVKDTDGHMRDNWDVMLETIDALGKIENETERDLAANELFGKSYSELKPLIDAGSGALQEMIDTAKESGYVLSEDQVKTLGEVDDAYQEYQAQIDATKNKLSVEFAPVSKEVMQNFGNFVKGAGDAIVDSGILKSLEGFMEPLGRILSAGLNLLNFVLPYLTPAINFLADAFSGAASVVERFVSWIEDAFTKAKEFVQWWRDNYVDNAPGVGEAPQQQSQYVTYYEDPAAAQTAPQQQHKWMQYYNAAGDYNWRGGLTWLGEAGPELVELPRGSRIHSAQESGLLAANSGTDTSRMEALLARSVALQEQIAGEFAALRVKRRMA